MQPLLKGFFLATLLVSVAGGAMAGARPPSEAGRGGAALDTRGMTNDQLRRRVLDACVTLMTQKPEPLKSAAVDRCGCYSGRVMTSMSSGEIDELRATGGFSPSARPKAQTALQACRVAG
ncbi:MAG: hypothetical protein JWL62_1348 [Hyphomicrobiales bacterium]|nr:hypothetical protein [Hyphomicrobiales bacterium]